MQKRNIIQFIVFLILLLASACRLYYKPLDNVGFLTHVSNSNSQLIRMPGSVVEGKRLTMLICGSCHYDPSRHKFSGNEMHDVPAIIGKVVASNLTHRPTNEISNYSFEEFKHLLRTGISRKGRLMPYMQRPNLSDKDMWSIWLYLHSSDDELVDSEL